MLKKCILWITVIAMLFSFMVCGVAANVASVYGDSVSCDAGEVISIPVYIKDNPGIMGFRITIDYPSQVFESPKVTKGKVTLNGSFNDSIKATTNGEFDVLWSNTENVKTDGILFTVELKVKDNAATNKYSVGISYDQADTFNEKWQDVKLSCTDVEVTVGDDVEPETPEEPTTSFWDSIVAFFEWLFAIVAGWFA